MRDEDTNVEIFGLLKLTSILIQCVLRNMDDKLIIHVNKNTNSLNETNENLTFRKITFWIVFGVFLANLNSKGCENVFVLLRQVIFQLFQLNTQQFSCSKINKINVDFAIPFKTKNFFRKSNSVKLVVVSVDLSLLRNPDSKMCLIDNVTDRF